MSVYRSKYSFELWTKGGLLLADLGGMARDRLLTESRNQPEVIQFTLNIDQFEEFCAGINLDPRQALITKSTEIRIKRLGTYMRGGQLVYKDGTLDGRSNSVTIRALGFLSMFAKRYTGQSTAGLVSEVYTAANGTAKSRSDLAWSLISQSQALTNGDLGITRGKQGGSTQTYDKTYGRTRLQDALQDMTKLETDPIDIDFTHDKVFNTYASIGSQRNDIVFEYPGNITRLRVTEDATDMTNEAIAQGVGAPDGTQNIVVKSDLPSQTDRALQQDVVNANGSDDSDGGITDAALTEIAAHSQPIIIPGIVVNGNVAPFVTDYGIGDWVQVKVTGHPLYGDINGMYRVEKRTIDIDNDDNETVTLEVSQ